MNLGYLSSLALSFYICEMGRVKHYNPGVYKIMKIICTKRLGAQNECPVNHTHSTNIGSASCSPRCFQHFGEHKVLELYSRIESDNKQ